LAGGDPRRLDPAQREAMGHLLALRDRLSGSGRPAPGGAWLKRLRGGGGGAARGLYLWGGVGRGKTYLMDSFYEALPGTDKRRLHFQHFMREVHDRLARLQREPDPLKLLARGWCRESRVLCLDELNVADIADAMILHRLLGALFDHGLTLVVTSNTPPRGLYPNGLQRALFLPAIDLLERHTVVHELGFGADYRQLAGAGGGTYHETRAGEAALAAWFERLAGRPAGPGERLELDGRSLTARGLGAEVAWLDFESLCGTPRSARDYIELAGRYRTVLLSGVPILVPRREAAARRFVHLVDELYDRRVALVLSAEAQVAGLYAGGIAHFPHERLLSRLTEMQSAAYLAACRGERGGAPLRGPSKGP
jgi:cell division protein ZapE